MGIPPTYLRSATRHKLSTAHAGNEAAFSTSSCLKWPCQRRPHHMTQTTRSIAQSNQQPRMVSPLPNNAWQCCCVALVTSIVACLPTSHVIIPHLLICLRPVQQRAPVWPSHHVLHSSLCVHILNAKTRPEDGAIWFQTPSDAMGTPRDCEISTGWSMVVVYFVSVSIFRFTSRQRTDVAILQSFSFFTR